MTPTLPPTCRCAWRCSGSHGYPVHPRQPCRGRCRRLLEYLALLAGTYRALGTDMPTGRHTTATWSGDMARSCAAWGCDGWVVPAGVCPTSGRSGDSPSLMLTRCGRFFAIRRLEPDRLPGLKAYARQQQVTQK